MKITKAQKESVSLFESFAEKLASRVPKRTNPFFLALILGYLLAIAKRRTVTQWLKAAQISDDFRQAPVTVNTVPHPQHRTQGGKIYLTKCSH